MDGTKDGGLGDSALLDNVVTPQQVRQSASKLRGCAEAGAGHLALSKPRNAVKSCGSDEGGSGCDPPTQGGRVRRGKGGTTCVPWTDDERKALFECYQRSGGVKKVGYIKRTKELYERLNLTPRSEPSLIAQLKSIEGGKITDIEMG